MNRATPVELRKAMEAAHTLANAGILFVPMPVTSDDDREALVTEFHARLERMEEVAE